MTVAELERAYRAGNFTPSELASRALRAAADAEALRGFVRLDVDEVHAQAAAASERWRSRPRSPLDGVPVAVSDQLDVASLPTGAGTSFRRAPAEADAPSVAQLRRAGAILFGKTHVAELALAPHGLNPSLGAARNPWDPTHDPGGASAGAAIAVATGAAPLAIAVDADGGVRLPAAWCGVAAMMPSAGRVSPGGAVATAWSLEHIGLVGATVADLVTAMRLFDETLPALPERSPSLKLGIDERWWQLASEETRSLVESAIARLHTERVSVALDGVAHASRLASLLRHAEAAEALSPFRSGELAASTRVMLATGRALPASAYVDAQRARARLCRVLDDAFARVDVLVTPTAPTPSVRYHHDARELDELDVDGWLGRTAFTAASNLAGVAAVQVPCGLSQAGLPVGVQLLAPRGRDELALAVALAIEESSPRLRPPRARSSL